MPLKYRNKKVTLDGITFDSKLEAELYCQLRILKQAGKIHLFECHVPFDLHGFGDVKIGVYKLDFKIQVFSSFVPVKRLDEKTFFMPANMRFIEAKGVWTSTARLKKKLFEAEYGLLEIHTKEKPWKL